MSENTFSNAPANDTLNFFFLNNRLSIGIWIIIMEFLFPSLFRYKDNMVLCCDNKLAFRYLKFFFFQNVGWSLSICFVNCPYCVFSYRFYYKGNKILNLIQNNETKIL